MQWRTLCKIYQKKIIKWATNIYKEVKLYPKMGVGGLTQKKSPFDSCLMKLSLPENLSSVWECGLPN